MGGWETTELYSMAARVRVTHDVTEYAGVSAPKLTPVTALYATRPLYALICVAYMSENSLLAYTLHEFS